MQTNKEKITKSYKISKQSHIIEEIGENGEFQYNCTACGKKFRSRSQRYYHIKCDQLQNLSFKCEYCDKSFARQTQCKYHTESHISPVNKCQKCQKNFSNPLALKKHLTLHEVEPKLCPHCDKTFKKKISLDHHIAAQHLNQLQYGCAHCTKKYASKSTLQLHLQTHETKRFECSFCGKLFQRNSILNLHLKRHYNMSNYICSVCQKAFSESGALARHRKIHEENVLQYYCKLCDKSILRKDNMTRHLITIHPEEKFDEIVKVTRASMPLPKGQITAKSTLCNVHTSSQHNIMEFEIPKGQDNDFCDLYKSSQNNTKDADKQFLIIENKLLHEPFEPKKSIKDLPKSFTNKDNTIKENPLINQIKVITAIPTYTTEIFTHNEEVILQDVKKLHKNTNNHEYQQQDASVVEDKKSSNCDFIKMENKVVEQRVTNTENISVVAEQTPTPEIENKQEYFLIPKNENVFVNQQESFEDEPRITQMFSSVIRSVGNVKKNLTSDIIIPDKQINQMSLEYKHKKYCRNNYNIDLYRKILGCDEYDDDKNLEREEKCDHTLKSSTPVHWRKCFKNNYETTGS